MRTLKLMTVCMLCAALLTGGLGGQSTALVIDETPPVFQGEQVAPPARIPAEQAPRVVYWAGVIESIESHAVPPNTVSDQSVPRRIPKDQAPESVKKVEFVETLVFPLAGSAEGGGAALDAPGTVTLSFGFYWYQFSPSYVAVAGYARTQTSFCATRVYAKSRLYRDVEHDGTWEYMNDATQEQTGTCVTDSGEALTDYWTAPNNTSWKNYSSHYVSWNGGGEGWDRTVFEAFP